MSVNKTCFAGLFLLWFGLYHAAIFDMVKVWGQSKTYEHGFLIVPIVLWLIFRKKNQLKQSYYSFSYLPVFLMLLPTALWMLGKAADISLFLHAAAVLSLQLLLWFSLGSQRAKLLFFPLFYLVFCIPFGDELIPFLQIITADISVFLVRLSGIPIYREGLYLSIPNGMFEVVQACSGIRFLISSIALGVLFSYLNFTNKYKHFAFISFCLIFPILANGVRAYGIILVGYLSDMQHATGADHLVYGWVFFSFIILSIFFVATQFADVPSNLSIQAVANNKGHGIYVVMMSLLLAVCFSMQWLWKNNLEKPLRAVKSVLAIPANFTSVETANWGVSIPNAKQQVLASSVDEPLLFFQASSDHQYGQAEFIHYQNALYDAKKWSFVSTQTQSFADNISVELTNIVNKKGEERRLIYSYCINAYCTPNTKHIKLMQAFFMLRSKPIRLTFTAILTADLKYSAKMLFSNQLDFFSIAKRP